MIYNTIGLSGLSLICETGDYIFMWLVTFLNAPIPVIRSFRDDSDRLPLCPFPWSAVQ